MRLPLERRVVDVSKGAHSVGHVPGAPFTECLIEGRLSSPSMRRSSEELVDELCLKNKTDCTLQDRAAGKCSIVSDLYKPISCVLHHVLEN